MDRRLEKPKLKHNKKRNTAFLYETLVKELTRAVVFGDKERQRAVSSLLKEHFHKNSPLDRELTLYKQFYETKKFPKEHAQRLIMEVQDQHSDLSEDVIFNEQSKLISKINRKLGFEVYNNFIPNYKTLATISQLFGGGIEPRRKVILEQELIDYISSDMDTVQESEIPQINNAVLKKFVEKFNSTYSENLLPEQKILLSKYIGSTTDDVELKIYLNEEIGRLKNELKKTIGIELVVENKDLENNVNKALKTLDTLKIESISENLIKKVMLVQEFVSEVNK